jgi:hypothetical protein
MPRTGLYIQTAATLTPDERSGLYSQPDVSSLLERECRIGQRLGQGSFGVAFLVNQTASDEAWVVKLPRTLLRTDTKRLEGTPLADAVQKKPSEADRTAALHDFEKECRNAEAILDPPYLQTLRTTPGARLVNLTLEQKTRLEDETRAWRALPGYAHLHPLLHYDPRVPMLISARALGTLTDTRTADAFRLLPWPSEEWARVAAHLSAAVAFILDHTAMAHMDIKPDNVFVVRDPTTANNKNDEANARYTYRLGDYGICRRQDEDVTYFWDRKHTSRELCGSPLYNPPIARKKRPMKYGEATCYQCFATLLATIYLPSEQCFLDDRKALYSVHAAAMESKGELFQQWRASPPDALLRVVVDALRDPAPAAWRTRFRALRARFEPAMTASSPDKA